MRKSNLAAKLLNVAQVPPLLNAYWGPQRLTVLAYHRIIESNQPDFDFYEPNVSATPRMFAAQMDYIAQHFNVICLEQLIGFIEQAHPLPARPLLITFDDGYLDNYLYARPILKRYSFPALIFLMTSGMDRPHQRPWWDLCAYYFHHTRQTYLDLPRLGEVALTNKRHVREQVIAHLKTIPEGEKQQYLQDLQAQLKVATPQDGPIFFTWEQARDLLADGITCQPHTVTHPILTRIPSEQVITELRDSRDEIAHQLGVAVTAFAYPNGGQADYNAHAIQTLADLGYQAAFTLRPGPMPAPLARQHPFEIQRVYLGRRDTLASFKLKVMGLPALFDRSTPQR